MTTTSPSGRGEDDEPQAVRRNHAYNRVILAAVDRRRRLRRCPGRHEWPPRNGEAGARKKGKKSNKKKKCRGGCHDGEVCKKGRCRCPSSARELAECLPGEEAQWCTPAPDTPTVCCPENRIYAVCPLDAKTASGECGAPEAKAPSVCCPESRLCGNRCCEGPLQCLDASTSTCTGQPPVYARLRRPR